MLKMHSLTSDSVERVTDDSSHSCYGLSNSPRDEEGSVFRVGKHALCSVEEAEVRRSVDDDTLNGHSETSVQPNNAVRLERFRETVAQSSELSLSTRFADIGGQSRN